MTQVSTRQISQESIYSQICGWSATALVFAVPTSRSLYILAGLVFAISWLAQGGFLNKWKLISNFDVTAPIILLSSIVVISTIFSPASFESVTQALKVYSKLPLILMLFTVWTNPVWQRRAWAAFIAAMIIVILSTYANIFVDLPWSRTSNQGLGQDHSVFMDYVSQSLMTAFFFVICVHRIIFSKKSANNLIWFFFALLAFFSNMFLLSSRSGLLALSVAVCILLFLYIPRRYFIVMIFLSAVIGVFLIISSPLMHDRLLLAYLDLINYQPFTNTSLGSRVDMWLFAYDKTIENLFSGTGIGTYRQLAAQYFGHCDMVCEHPHNQYLLFSMEFGIFGLAAFLWLIRRIYNKANKSLSHNSGLLLIFLMIFIIDCFFNAPLWYRGQSYYSFTILALLLASVDNLEQDNINPFSVSNSS
jgi:O-antigen ligase